MTEENYNYRTSPFLLRNQFGGKGKFQIPVVPKFQAKEDDFQDLRLIGFDKTRLESDNHLDRMVHFFLYDYKFERVWKNPDTDLEKLKRYRAVLTPDFSMYTEMSPVMQLYNVFRNRWCGAYYASKGIRVIPTVSWGNENTFEFCFEGIEKGSAVAVSTYMVSEHGNHKDQKEFFLKGYNEMLRRIEPETIICYNEPFPEMRGNIVFVDYDLSSWRYMNDDPYMPSKYAKYICGLEPLPENSDLIIKGGYVTRDDFFFKGMGSSHGGEWQPSKPEDERLLGEPGEIKRTEMPNGDTYETQIGEDGRAKLERHNTDHNQPNAHSNPHDHSINWDSNTGNPIFVKPHINYPGVAPEFKNYKELAKSMAEKINVPNDGHMNFNTISEFKWSMKSHAEIEFVWNNKSYNINQPIDGICILEAYKPGTEKLCKNADEVLEYMIDGERLRDIITKVKVVARTI